MTVPRAHTLSQKDERDEMQEKRMHRGGRRRWAVRFEKEQNKKERFFFIFLRSSPAILCVFVFLN
jgi:hypothetical protein